MCPACLASVALVATGTTSTGALTAWVVRRRPRPARAPYPEARAAHVGLIAPARSNTSTQENGK